MTDMASFVAACFPGRNGLRWQNCVAPVASPMCQAVDWTNAVLTFDDAETMFLKVAQPDMAAFVDIAAAHAGSMAGMKAGVAPEVTLYAPAAGVLGFEYLPPPWRGARLDDLGRDEIMQAVIAAKQGFRRGHTLTREWDVFRLVRERAELAAATATKLPDDMPKLLTRVAEIGSALDAAGRDSAPCHNDGQASNVMLAADGRVLLVDFDCAGQADPYYDLAVMLNEAYMFEADWRTAIEMHDGHCRETVLNRCCAYAVADDLLWGLWGLIASASSPRRDVEFLKYGEWRLLRARMALREPGFGDRLHGL